MASLDKFIETVANLSTTPTKIFIPEIGHRMVTKNSEGKILDSGNNDLTDKFKIPEPKAPEEVKEDGSRVDAMQIAQNMPEINGVLLKGANTLKSFQEMKQSILNDVDTDQDSINVLNQIEKVLQQFMIDYTQKKEKLKQTFRSNSF